MELYRNGNTVVDDLTFRPVWVEEVTNDIQADKALRELSAEKKELDRLKAIGQAQIEEIKASMQVAEERYTKRTQPIKQQLEAYMRTADCKESKTRRTYQLLSGKLIMKKPTQKFVPDKKALSSYLQESGLTDYLKLTPEPAWGEYKKRLKAVGDTAIDTDTGEVVPGVTVEDVPEEITWEE